MTDEVAFFGRRPLTRREVLIAREAYRNGMIRGSAREFAGYDGAMADLDRAVKEAFPLPITRRPRVVEFAWPGYGIKHEFRVIERYTGCPVLQVRAPHRGMTKWEDYGDISASVVSPQFIALLHDLFTQPNEEVEDAA